MVADVADALRGAVRAAYQNAAVIATSRTHGGCVARGIAGAHGLRRRNSRTLTRNWPTRVAEPSGLRQRPAFGALRPAGDSSGIPAKGRSGVSNEKRVMTSRALVVGAILVALWGRRSWRRTRLRHRHRSRLCPCPPPPPPPPVWTGSFGAGLAITQGNKDTSNFNLSFDLKRDPKTKTVFKAEGLYILATEDGEENADRGIIAPPRAAHHRAHVRVRPVGYVRDRFKDIDYLIAPTAGLGYKLIANDRTTFDVDTSVGMMFEKNTGLELETDGAVTVGEKFTHKISAAPYHAGTAALWKMDDFGDALYTFSAGLAASVTTRVQLKLEFQDMYKSRPTGDVDKNDIAFITAFVYKF